MRTYLVILLLFISFSPARAQIDTATLKKNIYASVDSMLILFKNKDWEKYADFMHPNIVKTIGGKRAFVEFLTAQMAYLNDVKFDVYKAGKLLQIVKTGDRYQGVLESLMQIQVMGKLVSGTSYDIIISEDGKKWNFTRIEAGAESIRPVIPELSDELKLPKSQIVPNVTLEEFLKTYKIDYF